MLPLLLLFVASGNQAASQENVTPERVKMLEILEHVRLNVAQELAMSANYTCVETIQRTYYWEQNSCAADGHRSKPREYMHDQLRLDVAVSESNEIFAWHGENKFVSTDITKVIPNGPKSSGQFVGFLQGIFRTPGVLFTFKGTSQLQNKPVYSFDYIVQLLRSTYTLKGRNGASIVPYHGSFSVDTSNFQLVRLNIIVDDPPSKSGICSADTEIEYQLVDIQGHQSLLPSSFVLKIVADNDLYTVSRTNYAQCREFLGESTLHFTAVDPGAPAVKQHVVDQPLPAGLILKATLDTPINDKDSYIGDAVQATLAEPLTLPGSNRAVPKGAALHGVISQMEQHSDNLMYWLVGIKFERLTDSDDSYLLNAWPVPAAINKAGSRFATDRVLNDQASEAAKHGFWFMDGKHFRFPKHFTRYWRTLPESADMTAIA